MELKDQVTSLEISKKLKELGVEQESLFYWCKYGDNWCIADEHTMEVNNEEPEEYYSAFTGAELGEMLNIAFKSLSGTMIMDPCGRWKRLWQNVTGFKDEANTRGKMLIYLFQNKLIPPTGSNK